MRHHTHIVLESILCLALALACSVFAGEKKISRKDVPQNVLSTFEKAYPAASIKGYAKEVENGKTYYEIESLDGKTHRDVQYAADGTVAELEETMAFEELPEAVKATVKKEYPKGTITRAEKSSHGQVMEYEIHVTTGKTKHELVIDPMGKIVKQEKAEKGIH